jgi:hypothetical protein
VIDMGLFQKRSHTMLKKFKITVPGVAQYTGWFASQRAAAADAERRFPEAAPAATITLGAA